MAARLGLTKTSLRSGGISGSGGLHDNCAHLDEPVIVPLQLAGDKSYRADWIDEYLQGFGIEAVRRIAPATSWSSSSVG